MRLLTNLFTVIIFPRNTNFFKLFFWQRFISKFLQKRGSNLNKIPFISHCLTILDSLTLLIIIEWFKGFNWSRNATQRIFKQVFDKMLTRFLSHVIFDRPHFFDLIKFQAKSHRESPFNFFLNLVLFFDWFFNFLHLPFVEWILKDTLVLLWFEACR